MDTHTIDEEWEASLLHRVQAKGSKAAEQWGAARASQVGKGWMITGGTTCPHGVAMPPAHGGQLPGDNVAATSQLETTPPRTAALGDNNKVITTTPHNARAAVVS